MSDITEGLGSPVEGGLLAHAVEPEATGAASAAQGACLNCGAQLQGAFCHACGQKGHVHRTLTAILHDLAHGVLHLDGKLWHTLPMLAFKPGKLTREYIDGKRARYVSPMAMFLFSVFLMFAVFQALGAAGPKTALPVDLSGDEFKAQVAAERKELAERLERMPPGSPARTEVEGELAAMDQMLQGISAGEQFKNGGSFEFGENGPTGIDFIDKDLIQKWRGNPGLMLYKLQANGYKFSWALIPLSIPFVWLLFLWRRQYKAYDHAIFVTYSLAFMSLLFIVLSIIGLSGPVGNWAFAALILVPPVHLYKQLRHAYGLTRFSALWRLGALSLFLWIVLGLFLQLLLLIGGI